MKQDDHLTPYQPMVTQAMRSRIKGHAPAVLWFTGLAGSGKSTIANLLEARLHDEFRAHTYLMDGDNLRRGLNADLGFSLADRTENIRRVSQVARLLADAGLIVLTAFISPLRADRDQSRALLEPYHFNEILVDCPLSVCEERDPKGHYAKARSGQIAEFTGISSPYERPDHPELILDSAATRAADCAQIVIDYLVGKEIIIHA